MGSGFSPYEESPTLCSKMIVKYKRSVWQIQLVACESAVDISSHYHGQIIITLQHI